MIGYGRQSISEEDIQAVCDALRSPMLTQGPLVAQFEEALAAAVGAKYCVAVANGTAALHLAVLALDLPQGSPALVPSLTFSATSNAALYAGLKPVFCDIDPSTRTADVEHCRALIKNHRPKVFLPVHFAGHPVHCRELAELARASGCFIIEDACHALAARYEGQPIGNCAYGDMACFSFHPVKHITTAEGGAVTTNDPKLYKRLKLLRTHGIEKDIPGAPPWYAEQRELGFNYRLTDLQCALGIAQLRRSPGFLERRRVLAAQYGPLLSPFQGLRLPIEQKWATSSWHLYAVELPDDLIGKRLQVFQQAEAAGIRLQVHYNPVHQQPYYRKLLGDLSLPQTESYAAKCISLPIYPELSDGDQRRVASELIDLAARLRR